MFFMMGINDSRKDFDYTQTVICSLCGKYGRYQVYMTYTVLSLFFIPCFKWNKHYYVQMTCCNALYELDPAIGRAIAGGERVEIMPQHLKRVRNFSSGMQYRKCSRCGFEGSEEFDYCPKCGTKL